MEFTEINTPAETGYSAKMKRDGITTEIKFLLDVQTDDMEYYWVELWSYHKRKDADRNMNHLTTFGGGVHRLYFARSYKGFHRAVKTNWLQFWNCSPLGR